MEWNDKQLKATFCTSPVEWATITQFRQHYFFDKVPVQDPYQWTFDHPDHVHFVLYHQNEIIGYAHIQFWPHSRAAMRIIVVEEAFRGNGYGKQFCRWIEERLLQKGYHSIHVQATPTAVPFYVGIGYSESPFDDPDGYEADPTDTDLGKRLVAQLD